MFLNKIVTRNQPLVKAAVTLHQAGKIPANCYLLDVDTIGQNAAMMAQACHQYGMKLFPMTKQIGRNPVVIQALKAAGADGCVCVDMNDARRVHAAGMSIGHLGHLVQVPAAETAAAVAMEPQFWTVYSMEKAQAISAAVPLGKTQNILARIYAPGNTYYPGHEGGFPAEDILHIAKSINALPGLHFSGITSFPTQLFDQESETVVHTHNYYTLLDAKKKLEAAGYRNIEINAPGTTSIHLFQEMSGNGVTQVEPGHGLTGTTPLHALQNLVERPAMVYVSEICHFYQGRGYCYGGGFYIDPVFPPYTVKACVGRTPDQALNQIIPCDIPSPAAIDYYAIFQSDHRIAQGDTAVFGFRAQAFVTRAYIAPVSGISKDNLVVEGIFDSDGKQTRWPHC